MKIVAGGIPLGDDFFVGRQACVTQIARFVEQQSNILVLGPRRTGKTSSIKEFLRQRAESQKDFRYVFIDLENTQNLYEFYFRLIKEVLTAGKKYQALLENAMDRIKSVGTTLGKSFKFDIDLTNYLGSPAEVKLTVQWPEFDPAKVEELSAEFKSLLASLKQPLVIVLDEFPELIWRFGQSLEGEKRKHEMIQKTQYLLSGLRVIRQEEHGNSLKHQVIIAGSINLHNTLKHLELDQQINDLQRLDIPYLSPDQCVDLIKALIQSEKITVFDQEWFFSFVKKQFGYCSPYYIQSFANFLRQKMLDKMGQSNFSRDEIVNAYKDLMTEARGPEYFMTRIQRFYVNERELVVRALKRIAEVQFNKGTHIPESQLKADLGLSSQELFTDMLVKMVADDMIQHLDGGNTVGFQSQFLCNFWNYRLVDGRFLLQ